MIQIEKWNRDTHGKIRAVSPYRAVGLRSCFGNMRSTDLSPDHPPPLNQLSSSRDLCFLLGIYLGEGGLDKINNLICMHSKRNNEQQKINEQGPCERGRRDWGNWTLYLVIWSRGAYVTKKRERRMQFQRMVDPRARRQTVREPDSKALNRKRFSL